MLRLRLLFKYPGTYLVVVLLGWGLLGLFLARTAIESVQRRLAPTEVHPGVQPTPARQQSIEAIQAVLANSSALVFGTLGLETLAVAASNRAIEYAERTGEERWRRIHILGRGAVLRQLNELSRAKAIAVAIAEESEKRGDDHVEAMARFLLVDIEMQNENYDQATAEAERARRLFHQAQQAGGGLSPQARYLELAMNAFLAHQHQAGNGSPEATETAIEDFEATCAATPMPWLCRQFSELSSAPNNFRSAVFEGALEPMWTPRSHLPYFHLRGSTWPWRQEHAWPSRPVHDKACAWRGVPLAPRGDLVDRTGPLLRSTFTCYPLPLLPGSVPYRKCEETAVQALLQGRPGQAAFDLHSLAAKQWTEGNFSAAIEIAATAAACFDREAQNRQQSASLSAFIARDSDLYLGDLFDMLWLEQRYDEAFWVAERTRARALLRSVGSGVERKKAPPANLFSQQLADLADQIFAAERDEALGVGAVRQAAEQRLGELRRAQEGLLTRAASLSPEFSSLVNPASPTIGEIQSELEPDVTVVSYFYRGRDLYAWVIDRDRSTPFLLATSPDLAWATTCYAAEVRGTRRPDSRCRDDQQLAEELYRQLVAPLRPAIRHRRLIIVPHGSLHFLPFAALRNATTGRTLVDDFIVTHLPSASILRFLRDKESPFLGRALVLGDPRPANKQLSLLPGSRAEAEAVAALFGTTPKLAEAASESVLDLEPDRFDVIHIAAHGIHLPGAPRASHIALSPTVGGHDGKLEAHEIYSRLNWTGVNLVVLSACETALGERSRGDDIVGLTRAILYAGASGVVSTLWPVEDRASADLMLSFYQHLRAGRSAAEALREAQLEIRRQPGFEHPHFWAGFVLTGDPRARWTS